MLYGIYQIYIIKINKDHISLSLLLSSLLIINNHYVIYVYKVLSIIYVYEVLSIIYVYKVLLVIFFFIISSYTFLLWVLLWVIC